MYPLFLRAIYGCIEYSLLWYNIFSKILEVLVFQINPYDRCVANKVIEGIQCTIAWYLDDNELLHKNPEDISDIINEVKKHFGELYVLRGNNHTFFGTNIEIKYRTIQVDMGKRLEECI